MSTGTFTGPTSSVSFSNVTSRELFFEFSGSFTGFSALFETSQDGGATWSPLYVQPTAGGAARSLVPVPDSGGATRVVTYFTRDVPYGATVRVSARSYVSGTAAVLITAVGDAVAGGQQDVGFGVVVTATDAATVTFDLSRGDRQQVTLGGNRTLALSGDQDGRSFMLLLIQGGSGSNTPTWFSGIKWPGGTEPTLTTTAGKIDAFTFQRVGSSYLNIGQALNL